jgi:hypothetical protein
MLRALGFTLAVASMAALSSCSRAPEAAAPSPPASPRAAPSAPPTLAASTPSAPSAGTAAPAPPPAPSVPKVDLLSFERVLDAPVHSLALSKSGRVAVLGTEAWMDRGKGLVKLPRPDKLGEHVQIYFGRDDAPRLMGYVGSDSGGEGVYARFRGGAWERGASEIGKLGGAPHSPLFGVLGEDDPEVVCRADLCILKRRTGWTMVPPPPGLPRVTLCAGVAWAVEGSKLFRAGTDGWHALEAAPSFTTADGLWAHSETNIWLSEHSTSSLHHFDGNTWQKSPSPIDGPRGLWATAPNDVWLVGDGGAAHYDGTTWSRVTGATTSLAVANGRGATDVWLAGSSGVWHGRGK